MTVIRRAALALTGLALAALVACGSDESGSGAASAAPVVPGSVVEALRRSFVDPHGGEHDGSEVFRGDVLLVLAAPIHSQEELQERLGVLATEQLIPRGLRVVALQDMSQALVGSIARMVMRRRWGEGDEPLLILDADGKVRHALGIADGEAAVVAVRDLVLLETFDAETVLEDPTPLFTVFER